MSATLKTNHNAGPKNKGKGLQDYMQKNLETLENLKQIMFCNLEIKRLKDGTYTKKQYCDYLIFTHKGDYWMDAKECKAEKLYISGKRLKRQAHDMERAKSLGKRTGFLVWFYSQDLTKSNLRFVEDFSKPITIESGTLFTWDMFL